ncbi:hypothetical protein HPP92_022077 [Vanilla planifolia]|uniref:Uncharacterized protein n=1 Tax=Vanilla planifolia TaxID=51239 RepID=A0A835UDH1_VANPL|nr:hypothetical protein HPP92_022077 [Vanilla planifolia]
MRRTAGMGGGGVLRALGRAVGSGVEGSKDSASPGPGTKSGTSALMVMVPSSGASGSNAVVAGGSRSSMLCFCDAEEWETVDVEEEGVEVEEEMGVSEGFERFVFGPVPSVDEAKEAVSTVQQIFVPVIFPEVIEGSSIEQEDVKDKAVVSTNTLPRTLSTGSQSDWVEPAMHLYSSKTYKSQEREKVLDAFRLLQINPSIQKIVVSLSSDRAVWDAVMKNEVVQEFRKSISEAENKEGPDEGPEASSTILRWFLDAKARIMEVLDKIAKLLSQCTGKEHFCVVDDVLRSSFMLSVAVFIIIVMKRAQQS